MKKKSTSPKAKKPAFPKPSKLKHTGTMGVKVRVRTTKQKDGIFKTAEEWFSGIQDKEVKLRLFANTSPIKLKSKYNSMYAAIQNAFAWDISPEGFEFWNKIHTHFSSGEGLKTFEDFKQFLKKEPVNQKSTDAAAPERLIKKEAPKEPERDLKSWEFIEASGMNFHLGSVVDSVYRANTTSKKLKRVRLNHLKVAQTHLNREIELSEKDMEENGSGLSSLLTSIIPAIVLAGGAYLMGKSLLNKKEEEKK